MTFTKTLLIVITATVFFNCSSKTVGGLTKEEHKSWEQQKKEMSPEAFKALVEEKNKLSQENFNLLEKISYIEQQINIIDEDGYIKYILGQFRDYDMADLFKKKLRKIGVKEAWIVPYKDGKRVALKEVLSEVIE